MDRMPFCPPKSQNLRMVEGRVILPTIEMSRDVAGDGKGIHYSAQRLGLSYLGSALAHRCTASLSSRARSVVRVRRETKRHSKLPTVFPAPSRPTIITENSSFLSSLGTRHKIILGCFSPGQILAKALKEMVHERNVTRNGCVTRFPPFHSQKRQWV